MNELVERLTKKQHIIGGGNAKDLNTFKEQVENDYIFITFTEPHGSLNLAIHPDPEKSDWENADLDGGKGSVHLEGEIGLNYVRSRLIADINLENLEGEGYLEPIEEMPEAAKYEASKARFNNMDKSEPSISA